ncbi:MAG: hypothetical protein JWP49_937, partial [Phenylobacterium sp.]|nr:hypothetical protein [Phenylobacterium sp.]
ALPGGSIDPSLLMPAALRGLDTAGAGDWAAELRRVCALFCRLLPAGQEPDAAVLHLWIRTIQEVADLHGGTLDKVLADEKGVMAVVVFGVPPTPTEGVAERGLTAALAVRQAIPAAQIGVATGKLFAGVVGARSHAQYTVYGPAANTAARLMSAATTTGLLCDEATRQAARSAFTFSEHPVELKGLGAVCAYCPAGELTEAAGPAGAGQPLAGRQRELAAIADCLAGDGGRLLVLTGEAGLGKSALLGHAAAEAARLDRPTIATSATGYGTSQPLSAWSRTARALLKAQSGAAGAGPEAVLAKAAAMSGLGPEALGLANPLFGMDFALPAAFASLPADERAAAGRRAQAALLIALVGDGGVWLLDDADRADEASLSLAAELLRTDPAGRLMITARTLTGRLSEMIARDASDARLIELQLLTRDETAVLAQARVAVSPSHPLVDWLQQKCRGNPQLAGELLSALPADRLAAGAQSPGAWREVLPELQLTDLPASLEGAAMARIARQPVSAQRALKAACIAGGAFTGRTLVELGLPGDPAGVEVLLEGLVRDGLLAREGKAYAFSQDLVRQTVHASLTDAPRQELHRRAAEALERARRFDRAAELSEHWREAGRPARAFRYARRAGAEALALGSHGEAAAWFRRALALGGEAGVLTVLRGAQLHAELTDALASVSEQKIASHHAREALRALDRPAPESNAGWWRFLMREIGALAITILRHRPLRGGARSRHVARLCFRTASKFADALGFTEGLVAQVAMAVYSARQAERVGDLALTARPYALLGYVAGLLRLKSLARFCLTRPRAAAIAERNWAALHFSLGSEYWLDVVFSRWAAAERRETTLVHIGRRAFSDVGQGLHLSLSGQRLWMRGDTAGSRRTFEALQRFGELRGNDQFLLWSHMSYGRCDLAEGDPVAAEANLLTAQALLGRAPENQSQIIIEALLALARAQQGRALEGDTARLLTLLEDRSAWTMNTWDALDAGAEAILAAELAGPLRRPGRGARRMLKLLAAFAQLYPIGGLSLAYHRGALAAAGGAPRRAARHWRRGAA